MDGNKSHLTISSGLLNIDWMLHGSFNSNWKAVACEILKSLGGLGLNKSLILMDPQKLDTSGAPIFYKNIFKVWNLFGAVIGQNSRSLFWFLQEPLIYGTRFDGVGNVFFSCKYWMINQSRMYNTWTFSEYCWSGL